MEPGLASVDVAVAFIGQAVDAGQGTVDAAAALDAQLQGIKAQMEAMAALGGAPAAALLDPYISVRATLAGLGWARRRAAGDSGAVPARLPARSPADPCLPDSPAPLPCLPPRSRLPCRPSTAPTAPWAPSPPSPPSSATSRPTPPT